jgi:hypothetical protein
MIRAISVCIVIMHFPGLEFTVEKEADDSYYAEPPIAEKSMSPTSEDTSLSNSGPNSTTGIAGIDSISSTSQPNTSAVSTADSMHGNTASTGQIGSVYGADQAGATNLHDPTSDTAFDKPIASNDIHGRTDAPSGVAEPTSDAQQTLNDRLDELRGSEKQDRIQETTREAENTTGASTKKGPGPDPKSTFLSLFYSFLSLRGSIGWDEY